MKKILAAIAACAMSAAMLGMTVCAAGTESDEDTLDDADTSSDVTLDDTDDTDDIDIDDSEEPADDTTDDAEEPSTDTVDTTTNPGTGNSPIALAVIPVALAAAAVVAKKAK